jgi:hypothetical protein
MPGKRIQIDEETWQQLNLLGHDQMKDFHFQELADQAFRDLLEKYGRPVDLKDALRPAPAFPPVFTSCTRRCAGSRRGRSGGIQRPRFRRRSLRISLARPRTRRRFDFAVPGRAGGFQRLQ